MGLLSHYISAPTAGSLLFSYGLLLTLTITTIYCKSSILQAESS
jgi:hypothetical protein